jgi:DNA-binding GntR family transcriptional regulator
MKKTEMTRDRQPSPPINKDEIDKIRASLKTKPRDLMLLDLITQSGVQMKMLLKLRVKDLSGLKRGDRFTFTELAGKVPDAIIMTEKLDKTWQWYLSTLKPAANDYIFKSRKGSRPLHITSSSLMVKKWFEAVNLDGRNGIRRLRQVWVPAHAPGPGKNISNQHLERSESQNLGPVKVKTVNESVYQKLFNAIITGNFSPGGRLVTHKLAKEMGVSQAPVREALRLLEAQGLTSAPKKMGSYVTELSAENFDEIFNLRIMLETKAIEKAMANLDSGDLEELFALNKQFVMATNANDIEKMVEFNKQFHHHMYGRAQMPMLFTLIRWLWDRLSPYVHILFRMSDKYYGGGADTHNGILDGIKNQDIKIVRRYLKKDLTDARKLLVKHFHKI